MSGMVMIGLEEATQKMYALYGENKKMVLCIVINSAFQAHSF